MSNNSTTMEQPQAQAPSTSHFSSLHVELYVEGSTPKLRAFQQAFMHQVERFKSSLEYIELTNIKPYPTEDAEVRLGDLDFQSQEQAERFYEALHYAKLLPPTQTNKNERTVLTNS